jgi:hypothetical protein
MMATLGIDAEHPHPDVARAPGGRRPGGRLGGVVGADVPGPLGLGFRRDGRVDPGVVGAGADQPGPGAVTGLVAPRRPADPPGRGQVLQRGGDLRGHQQHLGARVEQRGHPAGGDPSPAHDEDAAALEAESEQVRVHGS